MHGRSRRRDRAGRAVASLLLAACAASGPPQTPDGVGTGSPLAGTLVALGEEALAAGDVATATARFDRALAADPGSPEAWAGRGRALLAAGRNAEARAALEAAVARDSASAPARLGLAELAEREGRPAQARAELEAALRARPESLEAHTRLAELTGSAPAGPTRSPEEAVSRARAHSYDPRALLAAGEALLAAGEPAGATEALERALFVADLDPPSAERAAALLRAHAPGWAERRVVWVHVWADELLRARPTWPFQARLVFAGLSQALDPALATRFVPRALDGFRSEGAGFDLQPLRDSFERQHPQRPETGILAVFTGRPLPAAPGSWQRGQADFLGRTLVVRLAPDELASPVLAHEVLHLYGAMHVDPQVGSIMGPNAVSTVLDPWNAAIVRALRGRGFGPGGVERDLAAGVDVGAAIAAYRAGLAANVALRNAGLLEALEAGAGSPRAAAPGLRAATQLDQHFGDVASFLAVLLARDGRPAAAAAMFHSASRLYGPRTPRGVRAARRARALEARSGAS